MKLFSVIRSAFQIDDIHMFDRSCSTALDAAWHCCYRIRAKCNIMADELRGTWLFGNTVCFFLHGKQQRQRFWRVYRKHSVHKCFGWGHHAPSSFCSDGRRHFPRRKYGTEKNRRGQRGNIVYQQHHVCRAFDRGHFHRRRAEFFACAGPRPDC